MQRYILNMLGFSIRTSEGKFGNVSDFYFDDENWTIRYMIAETGSWLSERKVLVSLVALGKPEWETCTFPVNLTNDQVLRSPDIDTDRPVYRQHEAELHDYYQWPRYWESGYGGTFGITHYPLFEKTLLPKSVESDRLDDEHLRSIRQITAYHIHATDGNIGRVEDFIVDDNNWTIRYLVVDIGSWLKDRKVLVSPTWIKNVNWEDESVYLDKSMESIKMSPEFDPSKIINREFEEK